MHPEVKAADSTGTPCAPWTVGQLQPLVVEASSVVRIGRETNRLTEDLAIMDDPADRAIEYSQYTCRNCGAALKGRQRDWCSGACRKKSARSGAAAVGVAPS
jgi:hypothetical protein